MFGLLRAGASFAPLWLLIPTLLPWIPLAVPSAFLIWAGPLRLLLWFGVLTWMAVDVVQRGSLFQRRWLQATIARPRLTAALLTFVISAGSAWIAAPSVPTGDEPHYLIITQSLLLDGDLKIENNHARGHYRAYFGGPLAPHYLRRGQDGQIYSVHSPGLPVLIAPAFALGGYPAVVIFLAAVAACGGALMWHVGWLATRTHQAAWFGWASIALSSAWIFHSFAVYPDGPAGVLTLTGIWALLRAETEASEIQRSRAPAVRPWFLHGLALAVLPWLHARFAVLAGSLGLFILVRLWGAPNRARKAVAFLLAPAIGALGWLAFFASIYGTPNPVAAYGGTGDFSIALAPGGLAGLFFDQRFGLIANAPVLVFALIGMAGLLRVGSRRRIAIEMSCVAALYLLTVASYAMWWGGSSAPARFVVAALPLLVVPAAMSWAMFPSTSSGQARSTGSGRARSTGSGQALALTALGLTAFISGVLVVVHRGGLAFNSRDGYALWLDWVSPLVDLGPGMPAWFRGKEGDFFRDIVVWAGILGAASLCVVFAARRRVLQTPGRLLPFAGFVFVGATMIALMVTWSMHDVTPDNAVRSQFRLMNRLVDEPSVVAVSVYPPRRISNDDLTAIVRLTQGLPRTRRYGTTWAFFPDARSYPEPTGFWVSGGSQSTVVLQPDGSPTAIRVTLRNGPVENRVWLASGSWREEVTLAPGEQRRIDIPVRVSPHLTLVRIATSTGFRPSESDPSSRDQRFLGVWMTVE